MRLLKTLVPGLLALLMLGMAAAPISAQVDEATDESFNFEDVEGLHRAYSRSYTADFMAMFGMATPGAEPTGWFGLTTLVMEFDSEDNAKAGNEKLLEEVVSADLSGDGTEMKDVQLDIDVDHTAKQAVVEEEGITTNLMFATVQDGSFVYGVVGVTLGDEPNSVISSVLTMMTDAETEGGAGAFSEDGMSEGGLWDKLPTLEQVQELVPELIGVMDEVTYPASEATPAA